MVFWKNAENTGLHFIKNVTKIKKKVIFSQVIFNSNSFYIQHKKLFYLVNNSMVFGYLQIERNIKTKSFAEKSSGVTQF